MGGYGSGRKLGSKNSTGDKRRLDVRWLYRNGYLTFGRESKVQWSRCGRPVAAIRIVGEGDHVMLKYRFQSYGGDWQHMEYPVFLEWTACTLGGERVWFLCPGKGCGRRVAVLYGGPVYACRHCQHLAYASQRESAIDRAGRRADTIRQRLGWEPGILNPKGPKPKGMHWRTFEQLRAKHDAFANVTFAGLMRKIERMRG